MLELMPDHSDDFLQHYQESNKGAQLKISASVIIYIVYQPTIHAMDTCRENNITS